ncbi:protein prenyltransferase alpha subunit repeat-containing protein 1 [Copidosoma floridanum]|uniref:protein prenyltransferase alpha subunit repeat-containing protein 1 n=1 Tax=Copidosoma floridanum TaxID=29053 RepID=UPI0006C962FF|nr:protein prenyltransferase alpha subunit repeat-containing protein 1 [Copidosoma floridanum]XP_014215583.1 protein prenyltransferase alpha subunit repeat-containing protein 1 [Copidosoma floridanum]
MQEDVFPAAEKILSEIENVLKKDPNLESFGIFPAEDNENKSPVLHEENALGLASWCVKPLYCHVYNRLLNLRQSYHREEPALVIRWLLGALLLNPDVTTFWNMRREFVKNGRLNPQEELRFLSIVLYDKAKCFEIFSYRRWLLKLMLMDGKDLTSDAETLLRNEFQVTSMAAERYKNNSHAWSHRQQVLLMLESLCASRFYSILENEWEESTRWCNSHISDYSGFSYRQFLLRKLLVQKQHPKQPIPPAEILTRRREIINNFCVKNKNNNYILHDATCEQVLNVLHKVNPKECPGVKYEQTLINLSYWTEDCMFNEELINMFPGHEALWNHRHYLVYSFIALQNSYKNFYSYKPECFEPPRNLELFRNNSTVELVEKFSQSPLTTAFWARNKELNDTHKSTSRDDDPANRFITRNVLCNLKNGLQNK